LPSHNTPSSSFQSKKTKCIPDLWYLLLYTPFASYMSRCLLQFPIDSYLKRLLLCTIPQYDQVVMLLRAPLFSYFLPKKYYPDIKHKQTEVCLEWIAFLYFIWEKVWRYHYHLDVRVTSDSRLVVTLES